MKTRLFILIAIAVLPLIQPGFSTSRKTTIVDALQLGYIDAWIVVLVFPCGIAAAIIIWVKTR